MAERRMFAKSIVLSDAFLDMPASARCLYFTLGMLADDDGFVNNPKSIMRQIGASTDDMNLLMIKKFVFTFDSGVVVIKHWRIHNYIKADRYKPTKYQAEKDSLTRDENGAYSQTLEIPTMVPKCIQDGSKVDTQVRDRDRLGKDRIGYSEADKPKPGRFVKPTVEEVAEYIREKGYHIDPEAFIDHYESNGWMIGGKSKMKNWRSAVNNWERRRKEERGGRTDTKFAKESDEILDGIL